MAVRGAAGTAAALLILGLTPGARAIAPAHGWGTVGDMVFFHACNESGLWWVRPHPGGGGDTNHGHHA